MIGTSVVKNLDKNSEKQKTAKMKKQTDALLHLFIFRHLSHCCITT